ncbi:MAG: Transmembrane protein [Candidatus Midichloria mitochondrii]|uniref:DUF2460 domain-containing protein n=1 Tax=Midichloria mitochondrii (strain IricVA) TaxID=696127 RepID=F7XUE1_MIDMI|nr:hypothetical protein midi_01229 [Candidatus Midichloria mitochondrii IricVA]
MIGAGNNLNAKFQLIKKYESGNAYDIRTITKPVNDTLKIYLQNKIISSSDYKIDYNKGIIEFLLPQQIQRWKFLRVSNLMFLLDLITITFTFQLMMHMFILAVI